MKRRYLYVLLFSAPIALASAIVAFAVFGAAAGILWLFLAGDNPWPPAADALLGAVFILAFAASALTFTSWVYAVGRQEEAAAAVNVRHAWAAVGATGLLLLAIIAYEWHVGNLGPPTPEMRCADICQAEGLAGSGTPPRTVGAATCTCFDSQGREAVTVPMEHVAPRQ